MPQTQQVKMVICQPTTFEQSENICNLLKEKKSIIVNLEYVNKDIARRIVDVVSGAVHALDGNLQKVSNSIFLVAPYNYDITKSNPLPFLNQQSQNLHQKVNVYGYH